MESVDPVGGDLVHQRGIDGLLFLDPAHAVKHVADGDHLVVTAVPFDMDFGQWQSLEISLQFQRLAL